MNHDGHPQEDQELTEFVLSLMDDDSEREALGQILTPLLMEAFAAPTPPRRGSDDYMEAITVLANTDELQTALRGMSILWGDYGWRGPLDLMTEWILQIDTDPQAGPGDRDMFGVIDIGRLILLDPEPEKLLEIATENLRNPEYTNGAKPHEAFKESMRLSERAVTVGLAWRPALRAAFAAARELGGQKHLFHRQGVPVASEAQQQAMEESEVAEVRRRVFAALFHGPGRTDRTTLFQAALMVGTAAIGVRLRQALTADGQAALPKWKSGPARAPRR